MEEDLSLQISQLSKSLEKAIQNEELESIKEMLVVVNGLSLSPQMIRKSSMGTQISNLKKRYHQHKGSQEKHIYQACKAILEVWKKLIEQSKDHHLSEAAASSSSSSMLSSSANLTLRFKATANSSSNTSQLSDVVSTANDQQQEFYTGKHERQKIFQLLKKTLSETANIDPETIIRTAMLIEMAIDKAFPQLFNVKGYGAKARTLVYNLKRNENLRLHLFDGNLSPDELVQLSPTELATSELRAERQQLQNLEVDGRRSDWIETHREEVQKELGLDPEEALWVYDRDDDNSDNDCTAD